MNPMKINCLRKRFSDETILYAPELEMPEALTVAEKCYPAVAAANSDATMHRYFYILISELGEYAEYTRHSAQGIIYEALGGKAAVEEKFSAMVETCWPGKGERRNIDA